MAPLLNPHSYCSSSVRKKKVLLMVGDSITHQTMSGPFCEMIQEEHNDLDVVVCAQNSIASGVCHNFFFHGLNYIGLFGFDLNILLHCITTAATYTTSLVFFRFSCAARSTETILRERLDWGLACSPAYIHVMIGTNDIKGIYNSAWGAGTVQKFQLAEELSYSNFRKNMKKIIGRCASERSVVKVGVSTLPMMGEDLNSRANACVKKANTIIREVVEGVRDDRVEVIDVHEKLEKYLLRNSSQGEREASLKVENFYGVAAEILFKNKLLGMSYDKISEKYGLTVMVDALHLNDRGAAIVKNEICNWLRSSE